MAALRCWNGERIYLFSNRVPDKFWCVSLRLG
jgi:hypothetical protein